jgi:hypothetical protein
MADAPLSGTGWEEICHSSHFWKSEIFLIRELDTTFRKSEVFARRVTLSHTEHQFFVFVGATARQMTGSRDTVRTTLAQSINHRAKRQTSSFASAVPELAQ